MKKKGYQFLFSGIQSFLNDNIPENTHSLIKIRQDWYRIVGKQIAAHSYPHTLNNRILTVFVDDPIWIQELAFQKDDIRDNIHNHFKCGNHKWVDTVKFRNGKIPKGGEASQEAEERDFNLDKKSLKEIEEKVKDIEDPKLKEALKLFLIKISMK